jgi:hypothetical protein
MRKFTPDCGRMEEGGEWKYGRVARGHGGGWIYHRGAEAAKLED